MRVLFATAITFLGSIATAQTTVAFLQSVGPTQVIPDPAGVANGAASLFGVFGPATTTPSAPAFIRFKLNGVPTSYGSASPITQELILFVIDFGVPPATGTPLLGGLIFLPVPPVAPVNFTVPASTYMGPLDTVPSGGTSGGVQDPMNNGGRVDLSSLFVPAAIGVNLTIQGALFDPAINTLFTSNAINFQVQ